MQTDKITLYYGEGCSSCLPLEAYLAANDPERLALLTKKEIYNNRDNYEELRRVGKACGVPEELIGIPFLVIGEKHLMGHSNIIEFLEETLPG